MKIFADFTPRIVCFLSSADFVTFFLSISFFSFLTAHPVIIRRFFSLKLSVDFLSLFANFPPVVVPGGSFLALVIRIFHSSFNSEIFFHLVDVITNAYFSRSMAFMSPSVPVSILS
jgi:hypothetical protein